MSGREAITLTINGSALAVRADASDTLLTVVRDQLQLTGAKRGCNQGVCGACTILSERRPVRACLSLALDCQDRAIDTIEGLGDDPIVQALQRQFVAAGAFQCGFCTPGMLVAAFALLTDTLRPSEDQVRRTLSGNLCRCTGYKKIVEAVLAAADALAKQVPA